MINKEFLKVFGPALLIAIIGFWVAYQFVEPAPPDRIVISTGRKDGAYYLFAQQYRDILARNGVTLEIRTSAGSAENIKRLEAKKGGVDFAFVQGGATKSKPTNDLVSLGSLYYEPLWVFYRSDTQLKRLTDLKGKKVAVGQKGSGTRLVALNLLKNNGISRSSTALSALSGQNAANALLRGEVDAAFFIVSPHSRVIHKLLSTKEIELMTFERAEAYTRIHHYLSTVSLPQGVIDLQKNIPDVDTTLIAATANLVVRTDFHPALIDLLLESAKEVHGPGGLFERRGEFPSPKYLVFPLSDEAERIYRRGPSFLQRYLPFWAATFIDRMIVMLIPFIALLVPLVRILPPTYRWRMRSKIYRWYKHVRAVDRRLHDELSHEHLKKLMADLKSIEDQVIEVSTPLPYADRLYTLRMHINVVRQKLVEASKDVGD